MTSGAIVQVAGNRSGLIRKPEIEIGTRLGYGGGR